MKRQNFILMLLGIMAITAGTAFAGGEQEAQSTETQYQQFYGRRWSDDSYNNGIMPRGRGMRTQPNSFYGTTPLVRGSAHLELIEAIEPSDLSSAEKETLLAMGEEEKMARDIYVAFMEEYGLRAFDMVAGAEDFHLQGIEYLLDRYETESPWEDLEVGEFSDNKIADLYGEFTETGSESVQKALLTAAYIEELDIKDLEEAIAATDNEDIKVVYNAMKAGAYNHFRSFTRQLGMMGVSYEAQLLSQDEVEEILNGTNGFMGGPMAGRPSRGGRPQSGGFGGPGQGWNRF